MHLQFRKQAHTLSLTEIGLVFGLVPALVSGKVDAILENWGHDGLRKQYVDIQKLIVEAGMPLYGHELGESIDPLTAGLAWAVEHPEIPYWLLLVARALFGIAFGIFGAIGTAAAGQVGPDGADRLDSGQVGRVVQRRQVADRADRRDHLVVHQHRAGEPLATVYDPMADADQATLIVSGRTRPGLG